MSWFDNISSGAGSVMNWMKGGKGGNKEQQAPAKAPAAAAAGGQAGEEKSGGGAWGESTWAKATGLAPWAKALGMGQGPASDPSKGGTMESRVDHDLLTNGGTRPRPTGGGSDFRSGEIVGDDRPKKEGFGRDKAGFKTPEYNSWSATGRSFGNRTEDIENDELSKKGKANAAPTIWQPSLDKIGNSDPSKPGYDPRSTGYNNRSGVLNKDDAAAKIDEQKKNGQGGGYSDGGSFRSSKYGSYSGGTGLAASSVGDDGKLSSKPDNKFTVGHNGKGSMGIAGWEGQWGAEEKGGVRATAMSENKRHSATAEAGWVASGGASGSYGLDSAKGAYAQGGIGGKVGGYASADADTKTESIELGGEKYDLGAGAHADAFLGAKAGASGELGWGPDFKGAKGNIGAFAGFEAAADVHANAGPLGAKAGGSLMAGAGIGAEGDMSYKDGKFHVGGKMFAALGYGGALSADLTIDVGAMGRTATAWGSAAADGIGDAASYVGDAASDAASATWNAGASAVSSVLSW